MTTSDSMNRTCRVLTALAVVGISLAGIGAPARGDAFSYATSARQIKACVLVSNAASTVVGGVTIQENSVPYFFYMLDRRTDLRPGGWSFVNPLASSTVTADIRQRWIARDTTAIDTSLANPAFALGAPLTKNIGAYWEVNLDTVSQASLQQFDIVLLAYHNAATAFSPNERDTLRKYVDAGGTVWLEDEGGFDIQTGGNHNTNQFIVPAAFTGGVVTAANLPSLATFHHSLVNFPYPITNVTVQALGVGELGTHHIAVDPLSGPVSPRDVVPVIWSGAGGNNAPLIYAGDYGAGHILVSSLGIATDINSYAGGTSVAGENGNSGAVSGENTLGVQLTDAEFAINVIAWTSTVTTGGFNPRRTGSSQENIGFGLNTRWENIPTGVPPTSVDSGPAIYKNVVFYVDGYNVLHAYDLLPGESLNNNNLPDDGLTDYSNGSPYDQIWLQPLAGLAGTGFTASTRFGAPTLFSVNNNGTIVDEIAVQGSNGVTAVFNAFTLAGGVLASAPQLLYTVVGAGGGNGGDFGTTLNNLHGGQSLLGASAAISDGILFSLVFDSHSGVITDPTIAWRVNPSDPTTGLNAFQDNKFGVAPSPQQLGFPIIGMSNPVGSLSVGYVTDYTSGAQDKVIYVPTLPIGNIVNSGGGGVVNQLLYCVKNEPLQDVYNSAYTVLQAGGGSLPLAPLTTYRASGNRGDIPWFAPKLPWSGLTSMLPVCHRTTSTGTIDLIYDPTGISNNSFKLEFPLDRTSSGTNQAREVWVIPNPPLNAGDTLSADYTVNWSGVDIPDETGMPQPPSNQNYTYPFYSLSIYNPLGNSAGANPLLFTGGVSLSSNDLVYGNVGDAPYADRMYAMNIHFPVTGSSNQAAANNSEGNAVRWMFYPNGPIPDEGLPTGSQGVQARLINSDTFGGILSLNNTVIATDLESVGTPAVSNGVVYQTGWVHMAKPAGGNEWNAAIIMAYQANPSMTFTVRNSDGTATQLPTQAGVTPNNTNGNNTSTPLQLSQVDLIHMVPGKVPPPLVTLKQNVNFTVDPTTGSISIFDCRAGGTGESFNVCEPFSVYQSSGGAGVAPLGAPLQLNAAGHSVLDNLLWWMIIPMGQLPGGAITPDPNSPAIPSLTDVQPAGGPSIIGNTLYYGAEHGDIVCVDLTNMPQDGSQAMLYKTDGTLRVLESPALFSSITQSTVNQPIVSPPVGTTDVVVVSSPAGVEALDNGVTLIADNNRILQVDYNVNAVLSIDATQSQSLVGGPLGQGGNIASTRIPLARPNKAIHDSVNTFIVADSGNNRVLETNAGGVVNWEIDRFNNGLQYLRPGDPITLNHPTDVQFYSLSGNGPISFTSPITGTTFNYNGVYTSYHYLIADSGNFRAIELVDIYDGNGNVVVMNGVQMLKQVIFVTQSTSEQNKSLRYRTVQQFIAPNGNLYQASIVDNDAVGGADPLNPTLVSNPAASDAPGGSVLVVLRTGGAGDGALTSKITGLYDPKLGTHRKLSGPTYFKEFTAVNGFTHYLICDSNGCYDALPVTAANPSPNAQNGEVVVTWALYSTDYLTMTGRPLKASSLERLGKSDYYAATNLFYPHYLITNRYVGDDNVLAAFNNRNPLPNISGGQIRGEVVEVRGDVYFNTNAWPNGYLSPNAALYQLSLIPATLGNLIPQNPATSAIVWMAPKETIGQAVSASPPPIKRTIGTSTIPGTSSYILEQPSYSDRPY